MVITAEGNGQHRSRGQWYDARRREYQTIVQNEPFGSVKSVYIFLMEANFYCHFQILSGIKDYSLSKFVSRNRQ